MRAAMLLVGDELLGGVVSDRNIVPVARALAGVGWSVTRVVVVGDERSGIAAAARELAAGAELLVVCGGLGPTEDDRTREALADAAGTGVTVDEESRRAVEAWLTERGLPAGHVAERQATIPEGSEAIANPVGSARGFRLRLGACQVWVLPGVPDEAEAMVAVLAGELPLPAADVAWERMVATAGLGETFVAARLEEGGFRVPEGVSLGFLPGPGGVRLRLWAPEGLPRARLDAAGAHLREILGEAALPHPDLAVSLVRALEAAGATLATAESCTGGLVGARITDVPGASSVYLGGIVAYADRVKTGGLAVPAELVAGHGAVSGPVAEAMAGGCRRMFGSDLAVSVTGIAGPGGGTADKPVGTVWIGVAGGAGETEATRFRFRGTRAMIRERTVNKALELVYRRARSIRA